MSGIKVVSVGNHPYYATKDKFLLLFCFLSKRLIFHFILPRPVTDSVCNILLVRGDVQYGIVSLSYDHTRVTPVPKVTTNYQIGGLDRKQTA